jgi:hypothetical protein
MFLLSGCLPLSSQKVPNFVVVGEQSRKVYFLNEKLAYRAVCLRLFL